MPTKSATANGPVPADVPRVLVDARPTRAPTDPPAVRVRVLPADTGPDGRPRAPRREVEVDIPGYPGFTAWLWANYPQRLRDELVSGDETRIRAALGRVVVEHNGWCDTDGEPYPDAADPAFWTAIPTELATLVARAIGEAPGAFPQSLSRTVAP